MPISEFFSLLINSKCLKSFLAADMRKKTSQIFSLDEMLKLSPHTVDYHGPITTQSIASHRKESREVMNTNVCERSNKGWNTRAPYAPTNEREKEKKRRAREKTETKTKSSKSVICRCIEELFVDVCCSSRWYEEAKRAKFILSIFFSLFDCTYVWTQCWAFVLFCCALFIHVYILSALCVTGENS